MQPTDRFIRWIVSLGALAASAALWWPLPSHAMRVKEVATVQGVRSNALVGYGLVMALDGTGDSSTGIPFLPQSMIALLQQNGVTVPQGANMQLKNVATVMVTAQLPPFARPGQTIDITVSSMGNAKSLRGGTLISTPLRGADGQIYAMAQGSLLVGGAGAAAGGSKVQVNSLNAGRVPDGATVERSVPTSIAQGDSLQLDLSASDFNTAREVARVINRKMGDGVAQALDGRSVRVRVPESAEARVAFMADVENLQLELAPPSAKIVLNGRTGSIVMNQSVTLAACAVAHGNLAVVINSTPIVSQPGPFAQGRTVVTEQADISIRAQAGAVIEMPAGARLADVVKALNSLGATPQDLLAILQAMKSAGALNAEIEVI